MSVLRAGKAVLRGIYGLHKLAAVRPNRVAIISRQSNTPSADIRLLRDALEKEGADVRVLCRTLGGGIGSKIRYLCHMAGPQMHAIATSKVVVLDSYCIAVSILRHKPSLKVLQMWHAMGALKKFGRSILDQEEGSSRALAEEMAMHKGYDAILASSEKSRPYFAEAFGYPEEAFWIQPLPRTDLLRDETYMAQRKAEILAAHPVLADRKVILYAPTMRKTEDDVSKPLALAEAVQQLEGYQLVVSPHPVTRASYEVLRDDLAARGAVVADHYSTLDLLSVCDVFVSDYSAAIYEAAAADKPIYLYVYDRDKYTGTRGFYLDFANEMPGPLCETAGELVEKIAAEACDMTRVRQFAEQYIAPAENCTAQLAARIAAWLG